MTQRVVVNSRGQVRPTRISISDRDQPRLVFDFGLLMSAVDSYSIEGDVDVASDSSSGSRVTVNLAENKPCRASDLVVIATGSGETRGVTVQIDVHDRRHDYYHQDYVLAGCW